MRKLKSEKADKSVIDLEVKALLALKQEYKQQFGKDWVAQPISKTPQPAANNTASTKTEAELLEAIAKQGDVVRQLKTNKAAKSEVDREVKILLQLKVDFKNLTGKEWKPNMKPEVNNVSVNGGSGDVSASKDILVAKVTEQGNVVRDLKAKKAAKVYKTLFFFQFVLCENFRMKSMQPLNFFWI